MIGIGRFVGFSYSKVEGDLLGLFLCSRVEAGLLVSAELVCQGRGSDLGDEAGEKPEGEGGYPHDGC